MNVCGSRVSNQLPRSEYLLSVRYGSRDSPIGSQHFFAGASGSRKGFCYADTPVRWGKTDGSGVQGRQPRLSLKLGGFKGCIPWNHVSTWEHKTPLLQGARAARREHLTLQNGTMLHMVEKSRWDLIVARHTFRYCFECTSLFPRPNQRARAAGRTVFCQCLSFHFQANFIHLCCLRASSKTCR